MAIKSIDEMKSRPVEIDLTGPDGNVFFLMGRAKKYASQLGLDGEAILNDMRSSNYDHAVDVFEKHFGSFVTLYR